jgi:colanic acid/amylovoran biosynthesis glycosyltransferase
MSHPLAVLTYQLGSFSETFIKRHIEDLMPGQTVVVTGIERDGYGGHWTVDCPSLILEHLQRRRLRQMVVDAALQTLRLRTARADDQALAVVEQFLKRHGVRAALGEYLHLSLRWIDMMRNLGVRFVAHAHGHDVSAMLRDEGMRRAYVKYNDADGLVTMSEVNRGRLIALGIEARKIHVIPYGVDVPALPTARVDGETVCCVVVSRMTGKKAPILVLDAFRRALERHAALRLEWVGEGELMPAARQFVQAFGLGDRVTLHGGQPAAFVRELLARGDIFVQHSMTDPITGDEEGLPVSILEAMASSLPVVATRHSGIPESVADGVTGYLVDEGDSVAMAERIVELARDAPRRRRMGEEGWRCARERFSWDRERRALLALLGLGGEVARA